MLYKLSRFSPIHHGLRRAAYAVLWRLPVGVKYALFDSILKYRRPYALLRPGDCAVQVGAPWDIVRSGRSRALLFAKRVGPAGHVFVIEPVEESIAQLRATAAQLGLHNLTVIPFGAWSSRTTLSFLVDPAHPASNLVDDVFDDARLDKHKYRTETIEVDTLANLLADKLPGGIRLLSITTNGSETDVFEGVGAELTRQIDYVSVIDDPRLDGSPYLAAGFDYVGEDDRGYLLSRLERQPSGDRLASGT